MSEPTSFDDFVINEILESKARWLELVCASLIPENIARMDIPGNLQSSIDYLKARNAMLLEHGARASVRVKGTEIASFEPMLIGNKLHFAAFIAGLRVDVGTPVLPEKSA